MWLLAAIHWLDGLDALLIAIYLAAVIALPAAGYVYLVIDVRAYLRRLRGVLVRLYSYEAARRLPDWAVHSPRVLATFDLAMPCTEEDILKAYRERVKRLHPDRGGDRKQFLRLQAQFEAALRQLRDS